jgi:hypothetical protein
VKALTRLMSGLMVFLGVAIIVRTIGADGPAALGIVVGILFIAAGAGRLYATTALERRREEDDR